ncbi:MAG: HRDC domain-containing protein [Bacteroidia bacterium]|nr:HRDC domain-containing protein [Bacteroidia bacterium]
MTINAELKLAFDFVNFTEKNVFLTGKAGTGKTTFLHNLKKVSLKRMIVVAPTGVAAINAGGVTIHSFFQMPFGPYIPVDYINHGLPFQQNKPSTLAALQKFNREKINIIKSLDLLVIDEISMVRADLLDGIDDVLRRYKNKAKPFGGIQLLMIGDLQQLAPVIKEDEWNILKEYYETGFFFSSKALQKTDYISIELKHIFRQSDEYFIRILNMIRESRIDDTMLGELNKKFNGNFSPGKDEGYITLTTHNAQAQEINEAELRKLPVKERTYTATVNGDFPEYSYPTDYELILKKGAQVMFIKNDPSREKLFFNGKIGAIVKLDDDAIYVKCPDDNEEIYVEPLEWQNLKYSIDETTKEIKEQIAGTFKQFPLKLAWAITIHKSQGLTFDKAIIDAHAAFTHGQVYVALSRCRSLEGLVLKTTVSRNGLIFDSRIERFTRDVEENPPTEMQLIESKKTYEQSLLSELFDFRTLQTRIYHCIKVCRENQGSLHGDMHKIFESIVTSVKTDITDVMEKFNAQLQRIISQHENIENNQVLQDRIKKACIYFTGKTETIVSNEVNKISIVTDNKAVRKTITEAIEKLQEETMMKISCLKACSNGFVVKNYLEARAKAAIEKYIEKPQIKKPDETKFYDVVHPVLYKQLKTWREIKADEMNTPINRILPQKTLFELVSLLPTTLSELKTIDRIGSKKIKKYGTEILGMIIQYCKENNIEIHETEATFDQNHEKIDSRQISFALFREGKSVETIAIERHLAVSTIEGHLAHFVGTGELEIEKLIVPEKIALASDYFLHNNTTLLAQAKTALEDKLSYSELRYVLKHMIYNGKIKPAYKI